MDCQRACAKRDQEYGRKNTIWRTTRGHIHLKSIVRPPETPQIAYRTIFTLRLCSASIPCSVYIQRVGRSRGDFGNVVKKA